MKLAVIKNAVTSTVGRQILISQKHSPTLLFAGGLVGVVATTILASKATLKLEEILEADTNSKWAARNLPHHNWTDKDQEEHNARIALRTMGKIGRLYAPAVGVGIISVAALTKSHTILTNRNVALTAAYSALDKGFREYRKRVHDEFGEDKERELRYGSETRQEIVETKGGPKVVEHQAVPSGIPSIYARFFDDVSTSWSREPEYNLIFLNCQQNYANDMLRSRGHVFLNEVYDMLGIPRTKAGAVVGWVLNKEGDNFIDFGVFDNFSERARAFVNGHEGAILLDFNVDGVIYDLI